MPERYNAPQSNSRTTKVQESFFVAGGIYTDGTFTKLEDGTHEVYGPFDTLAEAAAVHKARSSKSIDICWHRLTVYRAEPV
jgi:hypothetical protein